MQEHSSCFTLVTVFRAVSDVYCTHRGLSMYLVHILPLCNVLEYRTKFCQLLPPVCCLPELFTFFCPLLLLVFFLLNHSISYILKIPIGLTIVLYQHLDCLFIYLMRSLEINNNLGRRPEKTFVNQKKTYKSNTVASIRLERGLWALAMHAQLLTQSVEEKGC